MATFLMSGKYSAEAVKKISPDRTEKSMQLSKLTGIAFTTLPAVTVAEFDKLMAEI